MSDRLPLSLLLQMSIYNVKIGGEDVIVRVADREATMTRGISELIELLKPPIKIVGIDVLSDGDLLIFHAKKRCLIIQCNSIFTMSDKYQVPISLASFLQDGRITFVGPKNIKNRWLKWSWFNGIFSFKTVVDVCYLVAQIRKKPKLLTSTLDELMIAVDVKITRPIIAKLRINWTSSAVLSEEEVKVAMYDVYSCYQIGSKVIEEQIGTTTRGQ